MGSSIRGGKFPGENSERFDVLAGLEWKELWKKGCEVRNVLTGRRIARERAEFSRFTSPLSGRVLTPDIIVSFRNNFFSYHVADSIFFFFFCEISINARFDQRSLGRVKYLHRWRYLKIVIEGIEVWNKLRVLRVERCNCINEICNGIRNVE